MSSAAAALCRITGRRVFATDLGGGGWDVSAYVSTDRWFHAHLHISEYSRHISNHDGKPWARVILGGVDTAKFSPDSPASRSNRALFVGRLLPHKGIADLIEALPETIALDIVGPAEHDGRRRIAESTGGREGDRVPSWRRRRGARGDVPPRAVPRAAERLSNPGWAAYRRARAARADAARSDGVRDACHLHARRQHAGDRRRRRQRIHRRAWRSCGASIAPGVARCASGGSVCDGSGGSRESARALSMARRRGAMSRRVSERMIHFLTPEYPPRNGGVADYTHQIATELSRGGETGSRVGTDPAASASLAARSSCTRNSADSAPPISGARAPCSTSFPRRGDWSCNGCRTDSDSAR